MYLWYEGSLEGRYDCVRELACVEDIESDYRVTHWSLAEYSREGITVI